MNWIVSILIKVNTLHARAVVCMNTTNLILLLQEQLVYALHSPRFLQWLEELTGAEKLY